MGVEKMYTELVRDNNDIIMAMGEPEIKKFVDLLKVKKDPNYLNFLSAICECEENAVSTNQDRIVKLLLEEAKGVVYTTEYHPAQQEVLISLSGRGNDWQSLREYVISSFNVRLFLTVQFSFLGSANPGLGKTLVWDQLSTSSSLLCWSCSANWQLGAISMRSTSSLGSSII